MSPQKLYNLVQSSDMERYWDKKGTDKTTLDMVDWDCLVLARKEVPKSRRIFLTKHSVGMCGVGKFFALWKQLEDSKCPRCGAFEKGLYED
jgi:hypothetical protein